MMARRVIAGRRGGIVPLLVAYPGAAAAYSLRDLTGTNPNVVRVRRSSDNAEQDFTARDINDGSVVAFVGAGNDGLVATWYDQSGNGNDATQATAASQPKIVSAGALVTENGKVAIRGDGIDDVLATSSTSALATPSGFAVYANQTTPQPDSYAMIVSQIDSEYFTGENDRWGIGDNGSNKIRFTCETASNNVLSISEAENYNTDLRLNSFIQSDTLVSFFKDSVLEGASAGLINNVSKPLWIFAQEITNYFQGTVQEIILYPTDQSANRVGIETNINNHYGIY